MKTQRTIGLAVETRSGDSLGKVEDVHVDIDSHAIQAYVVEPSSFVTKIMGTQDTLLIRPTQVLSINEKKMIVTDAVVGEEEDKEAPETSLHTRLAGVSQSRQE